MQSLHQKLEAACATLITQAAVSVTVNRQGASSVIELDVSTGLGQTENILPAATISAMNGSEFPQGSGNFTLSVTVEIRSNADETDLTAHRQLCEDALGPLMQDDTADQLNAMNEAIGVMGISNRSSRERVEDRSWITEFSFDAYCCGQILNA
jgi:hypothetical protein